MGIQLFNSTKTSLQIPPRKYLLWLFIGVMACSCINNNHPVCETKTPCIPQNEPHRLLSGYNFFKGELSRLEPIEGVMPYDLNTELFSDYAQKLRLVYVPGGSYITYNDEVLEFPVGSVLIKNFFYEHDLRNPSSGRTILETRLLMRQENGWTAETYVWNEEQDEAKLKLAGDDKRITWIDRESNQRTVNYLIPTKNDCKTCHSQFNRLVPLGPKARNLNKLYFYAGGAENQLKKWQQMGLLQGSPGLEEVPEFPVWDDPSTGTIEQRARAYLDVNCSNCHNSAGSADNAGLFLTYHEENPASLGVCKLPVSAGPGSGGLHYDIIPGQPDQSILVYRMKSIEPGTRMPEIGRTLVHDEAVELIREWITNLNLPPCE